ncbi:MAG: ribonuclease HII [Caldithrix sp.]|nr:ribonuclease HII [Caldithrix sp.]
MAALDTFDDNIYGKGISLLGGIDEAGRGPLAGPVVAAIVIVPQQTEFTGLDDSKRLKESERLALDEVIRQKAITLGIGQASPAEIDRINILQATFLAMQRAVDSLKIQPDYLLVDGRDFPQIFFKNSETRIAGQAVIGGDHKSRCIAAASVLAKVYRDKWMIRIAERYPGYGFEKHKGYGTAMHRMQIQKRGPSVLHRRSFLRKFKTPETDWLDL